MLIGSYHDILSDVSKTRTPGRKDDEKLDGKVTNNRTPPRPTHTPTHTHTVWLYGCYATLTQS